VKTKMIPYVLDQQSVASSSYHDPIHVLFIIDELYAIRGAEQVSLKTVRLLPRYGFRCSIVTFKVDLNLPGLQNLPCQLHVMPLGRTYSWQALGWLEDSDDLFASRT
jgi:hypothetical protein